VEKRRRASASLPMNIVLISIFIFLLPICYRCAFMTNLVFHGS
jgi:hypothetical protein